MEAESVPEHLSLMRALERWCDPAFLEAVRVAERAHTARELLGFRRDPRDFPEPRLTAPGEWRQPSRQDWMAGRSTNFTHLTVAWDALSRDFRTQIETGALHLEGVEITDTHDAEPQALPGAFASVYKFDFDRNALSLDKKRYVAITVSRTPSVWAGIENLSKRSGRELTPDVLPTLTDDQILLLLEEHAKRVVESKAPNMFPPGKISLMPIIQRKMKWRAEQGLLLCSIAAEATMLAEWIKEALPSHQTPSAATIKKVMGRCYAALKGRSTGAIQQPRR